jgi:hypothetical protein
MARSFPATRTIPAGASSATITVTPLKDSLREPAETVVIRLSNDSAYAIGTQSQATVTIARNP